MTINPKEFLEMQQAWKNYDFILYETKDGSPTLKKEQSMHHAAGALSETRYIYEEILLQAKALEKPRSLVVGLGLGYIEAFILQHYFQNPAWKKTGLLKTYESCEILREGFRASYKILNASEEPIRVEKICVQTFDFVRGLIQSDIHEMSNFARTLSKEKRLRIETLLHQENLPQEKYNLIFFDAYSAGATPELWSENFLEAFINGVCDDTCFFSTYACTGILKKTLTKAGFHVQVRPGFQGKRDSTLAVRG